VLRGLPYGGGIREGRVKATRHCGEAWLARPVIFRNISWGEKGKEGNDKTITKKTGAGTRGRVIKGAGVLYVSGGKIVWEENGVEGV